MKERVLIYSVHAPLRDFLMLDRTGEWAVYVGDPGKPAHIRGIRITFSHVIELRVNL